MNNDNKRPEPRKGFPGGFIIFLLAGLLIFLTVQNMSTEPAAKVSFSHQVESLVDLDLLQPTESRKIAQNDNLVTFTGKFRDRLAVDLRQLREAAGYKLFDKFIGRGLQRENVGPFRLVLANIVLDRDDA